MPEQGFICPECRQGTIERRRIRGREAIALPGVVVELPASLELPTCDNCLDYSVPESMEELAAAAVNASLMAWQKEHASAMVSKLCALHGTTRKRVALALDVTPAHLSHVTSGTKTASAMLLRLLRVFVVSPDEFKRTMQGLPWPRGDRWQ